MCLCLVSVPCFCQTEHFPVLVVPLAKDMEVTGLPDPVQAGTEVKLVCTVSRIKPKSKEMFWMIDEKKETVSSSTELNEDLNSFMESIKLSYR